MRRVIFFVMVVAVLLFSCSGCGRVYAPPPGGSQEKQPTETPSKILNAAIYVDATPSMIGYTQAGQFTTYCQSLKEAELALINGWNSPKISYYKFGNGQYGIDREGYIQAILPGFYQDSSNDFNQRTRIDLVLQQTDPNSLTVVFTDLFQNAADVNQVVSVIRDRYLSQGKAVGVVGWRSQFNGIVYDMGIDASNGNGKTCVSGNSPDSQRPFYLLVLGKSADVAHYLALLQQGTLAKTQQPQIILFDRNQMRPVSKPDDLVLSGGSGYSVVSTIMDPHSSDPRVKQLLLKSGKEVRLNFILNLASPFFPVPGPQNLDPLIECQLLQEKAFIGDDTVANSLVPDTTATTREAKKGALSFNATLKGDALKRGEIYRYRIRLRLKNTGAVPDPGWIKNWNWEQSQGIDQFSGNTTLNLEQFINGLWQATVVNSPEIAEFYLYVKK